MTKRKSELTKILDRIDRAAADLWNYANNDVHPRPDEATMKEIEKIEGITGNISQMLKEER